MKIDLEPPFSNIWKHAYVVKNRENRNMVCLVNDYKDRTTISLARYKMAIKLGRMLDSNEQVDHIDNDKTNDDINNLQLLTPEENLAKYQATKPHNVHGTCSMYRKGCRCDLCKAWNSAYQKQWRLKHPEKVRRVLVDKICQKCGKHFNGKPTAKFCSRKCSNGSGARVRIHASAEDILKAKEELGTWAAVARKYGVTAAALKWKLGVYTH